MRSPLLTVTLSLLLVCLIGWLLVVGRSLLLPFVIAGGLILLYFAIPSLLGLFAEGFFPIFEGR